MARSNTRTINLEKIQMLGSGGGLVIKLMICCNDLSLANQSLAKWKDSNNLNADERSRRRGAGMYFVRIQLAHLFEGLKIIEQITQEKELVDFIASLDENTRKSFRELEEYLPNASQRPQVLKYIEKLRHKVVFHYDESSKLIDKAIANLATHPDTRYSSITRGDHAFSWYFRVGDEVVNNLVVKGLWSVEGDVQAEVDEIVIWTHSLFLTFMDFAGEFIWYYTLK